jgi:hypothetical protein
MATNRRHSAMSQDIRGGRNSYGRPIIAKMPTHSSVTQTRLQNITTSLNAAVTTVDMVSKNLKTPFLDPIVNTMWSLLGISQVVFSHSDTLELTNAPPENPKEQRCLRRDA